MLLNEPHASGANSVAVELLFDDHFKVMLKRTVFDGIRLRPAAGSGIQKRSMQKSPYLLGKLGPLGAIREMSTNPRCGETR